jgi:Arv1-like family
MLVCVFLFVYLCVMCVCVHLYVRGCACCFRYNYVAMALILGSFGKLFVFFTLVWNYSAIIYTTLLDLYIFASQAMALQGTPLLLLFFFLLCAFESLDQYCLLFCSSVLSLSSVCVQVCAFR